MAARAEAQTLLSEDTGDGDGDGNGDGAGGDGDGDTAAAASGPVYDMAARSDGTGNTPGPKQTTDDGPVCVFYTDSVSVSVGARLPLPPPTHTHTVNTDNTVM